MEQNKKENLLKCSHDFPHEILLDDLGLKRNDLNISLQRELNCFDALYFDKMYDGILSKKEEQDLTDFSEQITQTIKKEHTTKDTISGGVIFGTVTILGVALALLGINKSR